MLRSLSFNVHFFVILKTISNLDLLNLVTL